MASLILTSGYEATFAYPEGAPWGAADPSAEENCATCHFDIEALQYSRALTVEGLPEVLSPDASYELTVTFENPEGKAAGFQLIAWSDNSDAGTFTSEADNTEAVGSAIRSTAPVVREGSVSWSLRWHTPANVTRPLTIYVAATSANHDQSPLGDRVHFQSYFFIGGTQIQPN